MGNIHTVGPSEALVISGGCCGGRNVRTISGGWGWAWWCLSEVQRISLSVMTLNPICEDVETSEGVPVTVTGVAQIKIMKDSQILDLACQQFLGKSDAEIKNTILQTLSGHLRAILGRLTVESIYQDRQMFAKLIREVAAPDVSRMGIEILSFTIKDIYDNVGYLDALGRTQVAIVKRDAEIGVAEAEKVAGIAEAEAKRTHLDVRYLVDAQIADCQRQLKLEEAKFAQQVNRAKAECELAYKLQAAKENQNIQAELINVDIVERAKQIEIEAKSVQCAEKKMDATVRGPAEAEAYRLQQLAESKKKEQMLLASAKAESIRIKGLADADSIGAVGAAEAECMQLNSEAYSQYGAAATLDLVLDTLPRIAAEIAAPFAKTKEIVLMGGSQGETSDLVNLGKNFAAAMGTVPHAVRALTDVDLSRSLSKLPGATVVN